MPDKRRILSCDGGGMRAMITLRCLEAFEAEVGKSCYDYFDMFAGTSGGAQVAGLLARGTTVKEVIRILTDRRDDMFSWAPFGFLHPFVTKYRKKPIHRLFKEIYGENTKLSDLERDIMITAVDTVRAEITFFTSFRLPGGGRYGTYRDVRLHDAVEASASAPTYYRAHGRFVDGGITLYNNPSYIAAVEALRYSSDRDRKPTPEPSCYDGAEVEVFSFGTGFKVHAMTPDQAMRTCSLGWALYTILESRDQASYQQSYVAQSELDIAQRAITFYRYDLYLTDQVIRQADPGCTIDCDKLDIDAHDEERFRLLDKLGRFYADYLAKNKFFIAPSSPVPVSAATHGAIVQQGNASDRWNEYGKPPLPQGYLKEVLDQFDAVDRELD